MPIFQYQCQSCSGIFEYLISSRLEVDLDCVSCGGSKVMRLEATCFYPNKNFCPHDKELDSENLKQQISGIMSDKSKKCGGCGTDGAAGRCNSKGGGCSCGAGGCGSGRGCDSNPGIITKSNTKLSLDIYSSKI